MLRTVARTLVKQSSSLLRKSALPTKGVLFCRTFRLFSTKERELKVRDYEHISDGRDC